MNILGEIWMANEELHKRMYDRARNPSTADFISFIAEVNAISVWKQLQDFLETDYELSKENLYYGDKYGWLVRYRKGKRTIVSLFPEKGSFSFLIVYGKKEIDVFQSRKREFSPLIIKIFDKTEKLHDGKWLWIRIKDSSLLDDLKRLVIIKQRPTRQN